MLRAWTQAVFNPRGAAVIGSCGDPSKLAWGTLQALQRSASDGPTSPSCQRAVVAVDPHCSMSMCALEDQDVRTTFVASPCDTPAKVAERIDLAMLVSSRDSCLDRMCECIEAFPHLKAINVVSGGFREAEHEILERKMVEVAKAAGIRLIGPNSVGTIDTYNNFQSMFLRTFPKPGGISLVSQSGGVCGSVVELLSDHRHNEGMNKVISLGNAADVGFAEALEAIGEDERTRVVMLYLEGLRDANEGEKFFRCAQCISPDKPIIALKAGLNQDSARAVSSHTGALAGNRQVYEAALREAGIIQATSLREMLDMAQALSLIPRVTFSLPPSSSSVDQRYRVAVVTNAGGPAALAVDALTQCGAVSVSSLAPSLKMDIASRPDVHKLASTSNPVDLLGGATPRGYRSAIQSCLTDRNVDAVVALHVPTALSCPAELARALVSLQEEYSPKPLLGMFVSDDREYVSPALSLLSQGSVPTFCHSEGIGAAFNAWKQRERKMGLLAAGEGGEGFMKLLKPQIKQCREYFSRLGPGWVLEHNARTLLDILGISQPSAELVPSASCSKDVVNVADKLGYPVVLKRVDNVHKSKTGGVSLNLQNSVQVLDAFEGMFPGAGSLSSSPILVCEDVSSASSGLSFRREFLLGSTRDDTFGQAVCFGMGGNLHAFGDFSFALPPQTRLETFDLLNRTRLVHSEPQLDLLVLAATVERISALVQTFPMAIAELDINPLVVGLTKEGKTRALALDINFRLDQ